MNVPDTQSASERNQGPTASQVDGLYDIQEVALGQSEDAGLVLDAVKIVQPQEKDYPQPAFTTAISPPDVPPIQVSDPPNLPSVQIAEPAAESSQPDATITRPPPSPTPATPPPSRASTLPGEVRRARHASAVETRSTNRLSGFFSNFIHRRDNQANNSRAPIQEETRTPVNEKSDSNSRASSPPLVRAATPPPQLPSPNLSELGLSLSVVTSDLSPSHFSTPPTSGAFLAPNYLLLCHAQGLDVLPLTSPPQPQPYALVRRVAFKSVVVMEQRGVLVAIAGRRDGVRVYALEEVKKAVEWRIDVEIRRERERMRRDASKRLAMAAVLDLMDNRDSTEKSRKSSLTVSSLGHGNDPRPGIPQTFSQTNISLPPSPPLPLVPRTPTTRRSNRHLKRTATRQTPTGQPPPYPGPAQVEETPVRNRSSSISLRPPRPRGNSITNVLSGPSLSRVNTRNADRDSKADWMESSDDEAINVVAAGSSGSQALDERTSVRRSANLSPPPMPVAGPSSTSGSIRRSRPANLDLSLARSSNTNLPSPEPSPAPTLLTLRQALAHSSPADGPGSSANPGPQDGDDDDDDADGEISLTEALLESRLPDLPPLGSRTEQQPILISSHPIVTGEDEPASPGTSETHMPARSVDPSVTPRRRRRWSGIISQSFGASSSAPSLASDTPPATAPLARRRNRLSRSQSYHSNQPTVGASTTTLADRSLASSPTAINSVASLPDSPVSATHRRDGQNTQPSSAHSSRFLPRIFSGAFPGRRREERSQIVSERRSDTEAQKKVPNTPLLSHTPPPKLEYVKLPGTKGSILIKAVETAKKSFLAILCGENGEKVELFAGTYRTALGLSRTFILPDSPRSLELQLQGDDLVEVFLVFPQNVFGLEPATVRVREVRIGRAERRAARRRARELRNGESTANDPETNLPDEDAQLGVNIADDNFVLHDNQSGPLTPTLVPSQHPSQHPAESTSQALDSIGDRPATPNDPVNSVLNQTELTALSVPTIPYTTFQQLSFAPNFPLASIADEYIIPPTYRDFIQYREEHEPESSTGADLTQIQFSPPGLPIPPPSVPPLWHYRDPKGIIHGPWKATMMQAWYEGGLLPPDLPVRREEDEGFMLLKDLRLQCVDPSHPFRGPVPMAVMPTTPGFLASPHKPLLNPITLLAQPKHFGPPALFFSSRGGHSTAIVDARGRSVLKGKFLWTSEEDQEEPKSHWLGDVRRLEAFDVKDRSVLVAMRQGGLEAVDLGDALLRPGDVSRTEVPQFAPANISRRGPWIWKIGTPVASSAACPTALAAKGKGHHYLPAKKMSTGSAKIPGRMETSGSEGGPDGQEEVLFLGRKEDDMYICERNHGAFRILRLGPIQ